MFELPESLVGLDDAALKALRDLAMSEGHALSSAESFSTEDAARAEVLLAGVAAIDAELATRAALDADLAAKKDAAKAVFNVTTLPAVEAPVVDEPVVDAPVVAAAPAPAAIVRQRTITAPATIIPSVSAPSTAIVASVDLDVSFENPSFMQLVPAIVKQVETVRNGGNGSRGGLFSIKLDNPIVANGGSLADDTKAVEAAIEAYLDNITAEMPVIAAGGWCAPAVQKFDICTTGVFWGGYNVPTIGAPRGSFSYFRNLDYNAVAAWLVAGQACYTVAELEAEPPLVKPCVEIPCVDPVDVELGACSLCIRVGLLQRKAFPELIAAWMDQAMVAYQHLLNARDISRAVALATNLGAIPASFGAFSAFLSAVELQAMNLRYDEGRSPDSIIEITLPWWVPNLFAAEFSRRAFDADFNFTTAQISAALAARNIRAQWVADWQDAPFAGAGAVTTWPSTFQILMHAPGAIMKAREDIITVGTLVDTALLTTNREQLLFTEFADAMFLGCGNAVVFEVTVCPNGEVGPVQTSPATVCPIA